MINGFVISPHPKCGVLVFLSHLHFSPPPHTLLLLLLFVLLLFLLLSICLQLQTPWPAPGTCPAVGLVIGQAGEQLAVSKDSLPCALVWLCSIGDLDSAQFL